MRVRRQVREASRYLRNIGPVYSRAAMNSASSSGVVSTSDSFMLTSRISLAKTAIGFGWRLFWRSIRVVKLRSNGHSWIPSVFGSISGFATKWYSILLVVVVP